MQKYNITFCKYAKDPITQKNISIMATIDNNENLCVPIDENNRHYAEILKQVESGDLTIADAD
jgi:hypothetical protein